MSSPVVMKSDAIARASAICGVAETWYDSEIGAWSNTAERPSEKENGRLRRPRDVCTFVIYWCACRKHVCRLTRIREARMWSLCMREGNRRLRWPVKATRCAGELCSPLTGRRGGSGTVTKRWGRVVDLRACSNERRL